MQYEFTRDVTVEGVPHVAGELIDEADIPAGHLDCLVRMEHIKPKPQPSNVDPAANKRTSGNRRNR